ncbi:hypothetical protein H8356DRAFT_1434649 [Neocallimastix lanati (nom. inval.)]|nr:hypothetical protein H8356DRAFT_1434649 [Neocallimastix sp. JGI-2020a]
MWHIKNKNISLIFHPKGKTIQKKYKCNEYKTLSKCPSFIILNNENQIIEYDDSHNHLENRFEAAKSIVKNKIKDEISNSSILLISQGMVTRTELFSKNKHFFVDGTFYIAPIFNYQVFITRTYVTGLNFISNAAEKVYINANIKYCIWHFKRALEIQKNELCGNKVEKIKDFKIKSECQEYNYVLFLEFLEYFKNTYIISYETENWNCYDNIEHITNNVSETFNKYLKKLFTKKNTFFQLLWELQKEEFKYYNDYERRTARIFKNKKQNKLIRTSRL